MKRGYEQDLLRLCSRDDSGVDDVSKVLSHGVNPNAMVSDAAYISL